MTALALISGQSRNNTAFVFPNILSSPLINGVFIIHCCYKLLIHITLVFAGRVIILFVNSILKIDAYSGETFLL